MLLWVLVSVVTALLLNTARRWLRRRLDLTGRSIFITGCDSGFGYSLALWCNDKGMDVMAGCLTDSEGKQNLEQAGVRTVLLNLLEPDSIQAASRNINNYFANKGLDVLVNNAAYLVFGEALWQTEEQANHQFQINLLGPLQMMKTCFPLLHQAKGRVVNMISNCTECPLPTLSLYTATKAGLKYLTRGMRPELTKYGIKLILVNPGDAPFETKLCSGQLKHFQEMRKDIDDVRGHIYGEYFNAVQNKCVNLFPLPPLAKIQNPGFYTMMESVLRDAEPAAFYENSDRVIQVIFKLIRLLPSSLADSARLKVMKLPQYEGR